MMQKEIIKYENQLKTIANQNTTTFQKTTKLMHTIFNTDYSSTPLLQLSAFHELKHKTELKVLNNHIENLKKNAKK